MKKIVFILMALVCMSWSQAYANFGFEFNNSSYGVTGTLLTTDNGNGSFLVTGGSLTGTGTQNLNINYTFAAPGAGVHSIRPFGATDLIVDNLLMPGSNTFLTNNGIAFMSTSNNSYFNIWGNGPSSYTSFQLAWDGTHEIYGPAVNGTVDVTPTPIPAAAWLLGSGLMGLFGMRRKVQNV